MIRNKHLSRRIADAWWSEFQRMLEYKTKWYGSRLEVVPKFFLSSKRCCKCGYDLPEFKHSTRRWVCPKYGAAHDRDINAAVNLLEYLNSA